MVNLPPKCASTYLGCHTLPIFKPESRLLSPHYRMSARPLNERVKAPIPRATIDHMALPLEVEEPEVVTGADTDTERPWVVIVWNDPINLMSYVAFVFQKLFGYSKEKANKLMMDVHHKGRAVVSSGTRSEAERDVNRLHSYGLWATMEHDE